MAACNTTFPRQIKPGFCRASYPPFGLPRRRTTGRPQDNPPRTSAVQPAASPPLLFHLAANGPIHEAFHRNGSARYQPEKCTSARVTDPGDIQSRLKDNGCGPFGKRTCIFRDIYLLLENKPTPGEECPYCAISSVSTSTASAK